MKRKLVSHLAGCVKPLFLSKQHYISILYYRLTSGAACWFSPIIFQTFYETRNLKSNIKERNWLRKCLTT